MSPTRTGPRRILSWLLIANLFLLFPFQHSKIHRAAFSAPRTEAPPPPGKPLTPVVIKPVAIPTDVLRCERKYLYQGQAMSCDSPGGSDGEGLRTVLAEEPAAITELNRYQAARKNLKITGYTGTLGLLAALIGASFSDPGSSSRNILVTGGLGVTAASFFFGANSLNNNEARLSNAVDIFNRAHPDRPIELRFRTPVSF